MSITLTHTFHSAEELASVLNSIGPPLTDMQAARTTDPADPNGPTTNAIDGTLVLPNGYESFADAALVAGGRRAAVRRSDRGERPHAVGGDVVHVPRVAAGRVGVVGDRAPRSATA